MLVFITYRDGVSDQISYKDKKQKGSISDIDEKSYRNINTSDKFKEFEKAKVVAVLDGDTFILKLSNGKRIHTRLIGIDCPEARYNTKAVRDAERQHESIDSIIKLGEMAHDFVRKLVGIGYTVSLEFDVEKYDRYYRLLSYVYLEDGRMVNEEILKNGYAMPLTVPPNIKYAERFKKIYKTAKNNKLGLWQ